MRILILNEVWFSELFDNNNSSNNYTGNEILKSLKKNIINNFRNKKTLEIYEVIQYSKYNDWKSCIFRLVSYSENLIIYEFETTTL